MKIPDKPRYEYVNKMAYKFFLENGLTTFPIKPVLIIRKNKWALTSYSELAKRYNCSIKKVSTCLKSEDGHTQYDNINYSIAYNDKPKSLKRIPFTLMHEIGHIYLNHLKDFDQTIIYRNELSEKEYKVLEDEANAFARNVLAPAPIVLKLKKRNSNTLIKFFGLSYSAANARLSLLDVDLEINQKCKVNSKISSIFANYMYKKHCKTCGHTFVSSHANFCPVCGSNNLKWRGSTMIYNDGYELDKNSKLKVCPICGNEMIEVDGKYCGICGTYLVNKCMNTHEFDEYGFLDTNKQECGSLAAGNHAFCIHCGSVTTFNHFGLLKSWKERNEAINSKVNKDDLPESEFYPYDETIADDDLPF